MRRVDALMSHYKPESQLSQINQRAALGPVRVDPELVDLIERAGRFSELTGGAFDNSYASVGHLYDYRAQVRPDEGQIAAGLAAVDWRHVILDREASTVRFSQPGVRIDLGGIAKGYAVDRAIEILASLGVRHASVTAGGDSRIVGDRFGRPWIVGIRHPDDAEKVIARIRDPKIAWRASSHGIGLTEPASTARRRSGYLVGPGSLYLVRGLGGSVEALDERLEQF